MALDKYALRHKEVLKVLCSATRSQIEESTSEKKLQKICRRRGITLLDLVSRTIWNKLKKWNDECWSDGWENAVDFPGCDSFFSIPTRRKWEIVVCCEQQKSARLIQLTAPAEEDNNETTQVRKHECLRNFQVKVKSLAGAQSTSPLNSDDAEDL